MLQGFQQVAEQLPEALHELWFRWHDAQSPLTPTSESATHGPGVAGRSAILAELAGSSGGGVDVDVSSWPARVLQLRLAVRHTSRCWSFGSLRARLILFVASCPFEQL